MEPRSIEVALRDIVTRNSPFTIQSFSDKDVLTRDLGFDSLAFLTTLTELERELNVTFPLVKIDELREISFGEFVHLITEEKSRTRPED